MTIHELKKMLKAGKRYLYDRYALNQMEAYDLDEEDVMDELLTIGVQAGHVSRYECGDTLLVESLKNGTYYVSIAYDATNDLIFIKRVNKLNI